MIKFLTKMIEVGPPGIAARGGRGKDLPFAVSASSSPYQIAIFGHY